MTRSWALLPLVLPVCLVMAAAFPGHTLLYDDLAAWFYAWKVGLYTHGFSLWNPFEFAGMPLLADIQRQMLYPFNLPFYFVPTAAAVVWFVALHLALAGAFCYAGLRQLQSTPLASGGGALVFSSSGYVVLHQSQLPLLAGLVWLPAMLWYIERHRVASVQFCEMLRCVSTCPRASAARHTSSNVL